MFGLFGKKRELNHLFVITLDSCRYDSFMAAKPENIAKLCGGLENVERRFTYASWTAPSHYNLLTGLVPHTSPPGWAADAQEPLAAAVFSITLRSLT